MNYILTLLNRPTNVKTDHNIGLIRYFNKPPNPTEQTYEKEILNFVNLKHKFLLNFDMYCNFGINKLLTLIPIGMKCSTYSFGADVALHKS